MAPPVRPKKRRLPPGQRLIRYLELATIATFLQGQFLPIDQLTKNTFWAKEQVKVVQPFALSERCDDLEKRLTDMSLLKGMHTGVFLVEPKTGKYADVNGHDQFAAASIIKLPVLVSFLIHLDRKEIKMDEKLTLRQDLMAAGSGHLQWRKVGSKVTVREAAELMITVSDNTATNLLIEALGGKAGLNEEFARWGLTQTKINNMLGDFEGTNKTSPYDLVYLLGRIDRGELVSPASRRWMLAVMERTRIRTLLPQGIGPGAKIAHKTGDIGCMVGDAGIITSPLGVRYLIAVQVERPRNDRRANVLVRNISKEIYNTLVVKKASAPVPGPTNH
ncbi:MAG: serine hydrolase [Candidatus Melainabacteria bacterium]|nr:MAG: serine hydrolase [Candidatus Melainabacteria bacterium]